jgi:hypothetical protein
LNVPLSGVLIHPFALELLLRCWLELLSGIALLLLAILELLLGVTTLLDELLSAPIDDDDISLLEEDVSSLLLTPPL